MSLTTVVMRAFISMISWNKHGYSRSGVDQVCSRYDVIVADNQLAGLRREELLGLDIISDFERASAMQA